MAYGIVTVLLAVMLCVGLVAVTVANRSRDDLPAMADGEETESETAETEEEVGSETETETETEEETEAETEPEDLSSQGLVFTSNGNGTCYVSGMGSCRDSFVILPHSSPAGDVVTGIGDYAFRGCTELRSVEINAAIRYIGAYAFYGSGLVNVHLPATLEAVGDFAFCACEDLEAITVDVANTLYRDVDGILYNKEMTRLITCPGGKRMSNVVLGTQLKEIATMAFYGCNTVKTVYYEGGVSSYRGIRIGAGNEPVESAVVYYSGGAASGGAQEK